jgi:hypothetical protein
MVERIERNEIVIPKEMLRLLGACISKNYLFLDLGWFYKNVYNK